MTDIIEENTTPEPVKQAPEEFRVDLKILRDRRNEHDASVTFTVKPDCRKTFGGIIQNYLNELPKDFRIKIETADDSVTHSPARLFIEIESFGQQSNVVQRLQQYVGVLQPNCSNIQ